MIFLFLLILLFLVPKIYAVDPVVKISNFSSGSETEWIQLTNNTDNDIIIENWTIRDENDNSNNRDSIVLSGCISPHLFQIIPHNKGWLNDTSDKIYLYNKNKELVDKLDYSSEKNSNPPTSTNTCVISPTPTNIPTSVPTNSPTDTPTPTITGVDEVDTPASPLILSEIMANSDVGQSEWVEIYNPSSDNISLKGLCFYDESNHSRCFPDDASISPSSYSTHSFSSGFLNNDGDTLTFIDNSVTYPKSTKNFTYSLQPDDSWCFASSSQNLKNNLCSITNTTSDSEDKYPLPQLNLIFFPESVVAGEDFNLVFSLKSGELFSLRLIFPFGSQYFPFSNFKDGYSWLTIPLSISKKLPSGNYPLSFHLKKADSSHLYDYQMGKINVVGTDPSGHSPSKVSKSKVLGASTYSCPSCLDNSASLNYYPASTLGEVKPDTNIFSWPFLFAGSILFLSPILFPKLYSA